MNDSILDSIRRELDDVRSKVDHLRVKANLGKMELRDALADLKGTVEPRYERARKVATDVAETGARESQAVAKSLLAGWEEVRRTYRDAVKKSEEDA